MIELIDVTKRIKNETIFTNVNYAFDQNIIYNIEGQNGLGKSTLLKIIGGLVRPNSGSVQWTQPHDQKNTGFVFDTPLFIDDLSFSDNLRFLGYVHNFKKELTEGKINYFAELFKLPTDAQKTVKNYSSGMKKKVELAMSLFHEPNCLIWDEPFNFLDKESIEVVLKELKSDNKMFVITTPNRDSLIPYDLNVKRIDFNDLLNRCSFNI